MLLQSHHKTLFHAHTHIVYDQLPTSLEREGWVYLLQAVNH